MSNSAAALEPLRRWLAEHMSAESAAATHLVGGVVRDALVGRELPDVDLVTGRPAEEVARELRSAIDGAAVFPLGDGHGCWRVTSAAGDSVVDRPSGIGCIDVCEQRGGSLEADLALRDFSANAIAVPVTGPFALVDPQHGTADIAERRLRMVGSGAFDDDPLRMLRAARIAHLLDWEIEPATAAAIRDRRSRAVEPAGERTFAELRQLLLHPEARRGWRLLEQLGLDEVLLPELDACRGLDQSRFHHLDVHDHTLAVLDNVEDLLDATSFWLPLPAGEPDLVAAPWREEQRLSVLLAALCHDLGKPATHTVSETGRIGFAGHDEVGIEIVDSIAGRWRWSRTLQRAVRTLVGTHLALGFLLHGDRDRRARWRWLRGVDPVAAEAVVLSVGDRLATAGPDDRRRWVRAHLELARAVWADHWRFERDGRPRPLLDGLELADAAGIEPGPVLGELVDALTEAQVVGEVVTRDQALDWARGQLT